MLRPTNYPSFESPISPSYYGSRNSRNFNLNRNAQCFECGLILKASQKSAHLRNDHGWVKCKYCPNQMPFKSYQRHVEMRHQWSKALMTTEVVRMSLKRQRPCTPEIDEDNSNLTLNDSDASANLLLKSEQPETKKQCIGENASSEYLTKVNDQDEPDAAIQANEPKLNAVYIGDDELNKLMEGGRIKIKDGKFFWRENQPQIA